MRLEKKTIETLETAKRQEEFYDSGFNQRGSFGVRVSRGGRKVFFLIYPENGRRKRVTLGTYPLLSLEAAREEALRVLRVGRASDVPRNFRELAALFLK